MPSRSCLSPLVLAVAFAPMAEAATLIVSNTQDLFRPACSSDCSLREAIYQANNNPGPDRIELRPGTYVLSLSDPTWNADEEPDPDEDVGARGDLDIGGELTIVGAGSDNTAIQGVSNRLIEILPGASVNLRYLSLRGGRADTYGGAIRNDGEAVIAYVGFYDNRATPGIQGKGGAIANFGDLGVSFSLFRGNNSNGDEGFTGQGGAIYNLSTLLVRDTHFENNSVTDNDVDYAHGGAIYNEGYADVSRSSFFGNRAGEYEGGGGGAAIVNNERGVFVLVNSAVAGNIGTEVNGVVANGLSGYLPSGMEASMQLVNVTLVANQGLGLSNLGSMKVRNSIVAGNVYEAQPANCGDQGGYFLGRGFMLGAGGGSCAHDLTLDDAQLFTQAMDPQVRSTGLGVENGTQYYVLIQGSPALDAGRGSCTSYDQRRMQRPRPGDQLASAECDLGAFERRLPWVE